MTMRILRVAQKLYPEVSGGGTYHVHAMSRDQAAMGHEVTVATIRRDPDSPTVEQRDGYTVRRFDPVAAPLGNEISPGLARYLQRNTEFDVVHAHSHLYFSTNLAALDRWLSETPLAITNHGLYSQTASEWVFGLYLHTLGRWTFNRADMVFCYTNEDRERIKNFDVKTKIEVVHNGIDTNRFRPAGPTSNEIDHDGPVVLFVGRLIEGKRPQDAFKAVSRLSDKMDARLYVVGDGKMRKELETMASGSIRFLGQVPYNEMPNIYRAADAMILPSRAEGFPRTVLESLSSGVPVVSSHLDHTAPIIKEVGETVSVGAIDAYCNALERVITAGSKIRDRGRQVAVDRFQWAETVAETTERLERLV